jgi:hypothetical protein
MNIAAPLKVTPVFLVAKSRVKIKVQMIVRINKTGKSNGPVKN